MKFSLLVLGAASLAFAPLHNNGATLDAIPMQGGMVMPMVSYNASKNRLSVMLDPTVPELIPLLVSHPGDQFDPTAPWFEALDPSGEGRAFSRRYGFVMDSMTDLLPAGTSMWIRKISGTEGLAAHNYSTTPPGLFAPIFGTEGASAEFRWSGMMFHPVFSAPPGTNAHSATFEVYLVEDASGTEIENSSTGPFVFNWTNTADGRPELRIDPDLTVSWPATAATYVLEATSELPAGEWTAVDGQAVALEGRTGVILQPGEARQFLRLRLVP